MAGKRAFNQTCPLLYLLTNALPATVFGIKWGRKCAMECSFVGSNLGFSMSHGVCFLEVFPKKTLQSKAMFHFKDPTTIKKLLT